MNAAWEGPSRKTVRWGKTLPAPALLPGLMLAWLAGTAWQLQQPSLLVQLFSPASLALALPALVGVGLLAAWGLRRRPGWRLVVLAPSVAAVAFCVAEARASWRLSQALPAHLEGRDLLIEGRVQGLPRFMPEGVLFEVRVESSSLAGKPVQLPPAISLSWYRGFDGESLVAEPPMPVKAGDRWRWTVRLKRPHGLMNPHGFDLELWLFERGLGATGMVRGEATWLGSSGEDRLDRWRQQLRDGLLRRAEREADNPAEANAAGVLAALSVGDQSSIDKAGWELFRVTGVSHLMSVSGLHVTMWAWVASVLVGQLWSRSVSLLRHCPAPVAARWGGLLLALAYALLAGWGVPAQRTVWMLAVVTVMQGSGRLWPAHWVLLVAATVVVVLDPWALLQVGFWLSFVAVAMLILSGDGQAAVAVFDIGAQVRAALRTQWMATLGLAPLTLLFFQQLSVVGFVANLFAIPWVTLVVTPLAMLSMVLPALQPAAEGAVGVLMAMLQPLSLGPWATWSAAAAAPWVALAGLLGGVLAIAPLPLGLRICGACLIVPMLLSRADAPEWGEVRLVALDVGQGTAFSVQTQRHRLLYDTGPMYGRGAAPSDAGSRVLLPWLRSQGQPPIDRLVLSHRDSDHTGGARTLLAQARVHSSLSSLEDGHSLLSQLPRHQRCEAGQHWVWDGVRFEVLHPSREDYERALKPNAVSCVIRVIDRHGPRVLLTGDIEAAQEAELVRRLGHSQATDSSPGTLHASILMLPHHGSQTSSSPAFLDAVRAQITLAQAAYRSRFGHPAATVVERVQLRGALLYRSDACGAWQWPSSPAPTPRHAAGLANPVDPGFCERDRSRRYWHHPGEP